MNGCGEGLIIAIESTLLPGSISIGERCRVVSTAFVEEGRQFSGEFLPLLERMLKSAGKSPEEISGVVVSQGPGSFTGIRVGLSFAKGISLALSVPVYPVPGLDVMAYFAASAVSDEWELYPCLDARKGEVYTACYVLRNSFPVREGNYISITPENLVYKIENRKALVFGPGFERYEEFFLSKGIGKGDFELRGVCLDSRRLLEYFFRCEEVMPVDPERLSAIYVRPSEAELKHKGG